MKHVYCLFALCLLLPSRLLAQYNQVPDNIEVAALQQLYYDQHGSSWTHNTNWLSGQTLPDVAQWYGVTVTNGDVTGLQLSSNNLSGNLSPIIGQLAALQTVDFAFNDLTGAIPDEIGSLQALQSLRLCYNEFTRTLPVSLGNLTQLQALNVSYNQLEGDLPLLNAAVQLAQVDVSHNQLSGKLDLVSQFNSSALSYLDLSHNQLIGSLTPDLGQYSSLQYLSLSDNQLEGELPNELWQLSSIYYLDLAANKFKGTLSTAVYKLSALQFLYLDHNQFENNLPDTMWQLSLLQELALNNNGFTGQLPGGIEQAAALTDVSVAYNQLTGELPAGISLLPALSFLDASNNQFTGHIDNRLTYSSSLWYLSLANNQFSGVLPTNFGYPGQLSALYYLDLSGNLLTGNLPTGLAQITSLRYLYLDHNQFNGSIPATLSTLSSLQEINVAANQFAGNLPTGSQWSSLTYARFDQNQFSGAVPASLLGQPYLRAIWLGTNQLTSLPAPPAGTNLSALHVEANHLGFDSLEPYFTGPGIGLYADFQYTDQTLPADEHILSVNTGQSWNLSSAIGGTRSHYQWQYSPLSGGWQNLSSTTTSYQRSAAVAGDAGRYQCAVVNDWVIGVTLYSPVTTVRVQQALPPDNPSTDTDRNWTLERTYDGNGELAGNVVSESKQFVDGLGRPTQAQARNAATQQAFAEQTIYNSGGQAVLQTLAAPTNNQSFAYKTDFVTAGATAYGPANFEDAKANAPDAVDNTALGTLGYYFSKNNALEPLTPVTSYPYSLTEPYTGPLGGTKRAAAPGDELRMGKGREAKGREFLVRQEFDNYLTLRPQFVSGSTATTLEYQAEKSISVDVDGREGFVVTNKEGQAIISGLSGAQYTALPVSGYLTAETPPTADPNAPAYTDIHIPAAGNQAVTFTPGSWTGGSVRIVDLLTDASYDYPITSTVTSVTPAAGSYAYTATSSNTQVTLPPGFYRFVSLTGTQYYTYDAHYGNLSYTYYDEAGRVVATVAPNGLAGGNLLRNAGFEQDQVGTATPSAWQTGTATTAGAAYTETQAGSPAHGGSFYGVHWRPGPAAWSAYTYQVVSGLPNGYYTLRAWVENTGNISAYMQAQNYGGGVLQVALPSMSGSDPWQQITLTNIHVTNGQCEVGFTSSASGNAWIRFDDVEFVRLADASTPTFVTRNTYDSSGRLLATESNDEGRSEYVYAQDGRIRFSQSALQRLDSRYSYSNYDEIGRVVESGEYVPGSYAVNVFENHLTTTPASNSVLQAAILESRARNGNLYPNWCHQRNQVWYDLPFDGSTGSQGNDAQLNGRQQQFVTGAVAKTKNDNVTTWYSYDELGRVTWVVQDIVGVGVKTLDYQYDFSGNVLQVAYQQDQPDRFYHYYAYDAAQRLSTAHTSPDGVNRTLQAEYSYYLHGPLKRVQLASNLQGVDYTYTLQGTLKNLNHVNPTLEPGHDSPRTTGVYKDLFALTLDYFSGDYASRALDVAAPTGSNVPTRYDGTIQGAAWRTAASADVQRVVYSYDEKSQLQNSTFGKVTTAGTATQFTPSLVGALQEGGLTYDLNGNIQSLRRTSQTGTVTDNFSYSYKPNTNQLKEVHTGSPSGVTVLSYDYDEIGQMTRQTDEQGARYFTYDVTGKTTGVYYDQAHQQPAVTFTYDDRGFRVSKTVYPAANVAPASTTYYVRDVAGNVLAIYEQLAPGATVQRSEVPLYGSGRLGVLTHVADGTAGGSDDYRYELNDHLGDARVVFHRPTMTTDVETMEPSGVPARAAFLNDNLYRVYHTRPGVIGGNFVARLTGSQPYGQELKRTLTVLKGDTITFSALGLLEDAVAARTVNVAQRVQPYLLLGTAAPASDQPTTNETGQRAASAGTGKWLGRFAAGLSFTLGGHRYKQAAPNGQGARTMQAWIRYQLYDDQGGAIGLPVYSYLTGFSGWEQVRLGVRMPQNGSIEVMAGTNSGNDAVAYFDNLTVEQTGGLIIQEQHQYAFGAPLPGLSYTVGGVKHYRYGYQGQYAEHDAETGLESFELRLYNSRVGRWLTADPKGQFQSPYLGVGNEPTTSTDANGGWSLSGALIGAGVGAAVGAGIGAGINWASGGKSEGYLHAMIGFGLIGAGSGAYFGGNYGGNWASSLSQINLPHINLPHINLPSLAAQTPWHSIGQLPGHFPNIRQQGTLDCVPANSQANDNYFGGTKTEQTFTNPFTPQTFPGVGDATSWYIGRFIIGSMPTNTPPSPTTIANELNAGHPITLALGPFFDNSNPPRRFNHNVTIWGIEQKTRRSGKVVHRLRVMDPAGGQFPDKSSYNYMLSKFVQGINLLNTKP